MANNSTQLTPDVIKTVSELINVRRISDFNVIDIYDPNDGSITSGQFNNSYLLTSTYLVDRYYNYRVKLKEITDYVHDLGHNDVSSLHNMFDYFISTLVNNTENSYVKLAFAYNETDLPLDKPIDYYAYTFKYTLSDFQSDSYIPFSYNGEDESSYAYTNVLSHGLITSDVLERYIRETLGRILGVPATPAYVSEAIDSVIEFVDWFKGYTYNDSDAGNLQKLIDTIERKDNIIRRDYAAADQAIITSYEAADAKIINSYTRADAKIITSYKDADTKIINSYTRADANLQQQINDINTAMDNLDVPVKGVDNEHTKSFIIDNTQYTLTLNSSGMLLIDTLDDTYEEFKWVNGYPNPSSIAAKEYDKDGRGTTNTKSITLKFKVNKNSYVDGTPTINNLATNWGNNNFIDGSSITANTEYSYATSYTVNTTTSFKIKITENPLSQQDITFGHTAQSKNYNITNQYTKFGVWIFSSTSQIASDIFDLDNSLQLISNDVTIEINNPQKILWTGQSSISTSINIGNSNEYVYVLIPSDWITPSYKFFWGGSTTPEDANRVCNTVTLYSNNRNYYLYRSLRIQTGNEFGEFGVEYRNPNN